VVDDLKLSDYGCSMILDSGFVEVLYFLREIIIITIPAGLAARTTLASCESTAEVLTEIMKTPPNPRFSHS
jgi:hypothetical protein